jgi:phenylalanine ammonia-lyase
MTIIISGAGLTIAEIATVAHEAKVAHTTDKGVLDRIEHPAQSSRTVSPGGADLRSHTLFGGMADQYVGPELLEQLQTVALWQQNSTTGPRPPDPDVRAAMLLRTNSLMKEAALDGVKRWGCALRTDSMKLRRTTSKIHRDKSRTVK